MDTQLDSAVWWVVLMLFQASPVLFYLLTSRNYYKIAHIPMTFPRWRLSWLLLTIALIGLSITRIFNMINVAQVDPEDWLVNIQTGFVLVSSMCIYVSSICCWGIFREMLCSRS